MRVSLHYSVGMFKDFFYVVVLLLLLLLLLLHYALQLYTLRQDKDYDYGLIFPVTGS